MSEKNGGVPYPKCLMSLPAAIVMTLLAMWRHRGEVRGMWREVNS